MSRRKKSHQSHGTPVRPRLWGKHAVAAALDNPGRKVLKAWATREATAFMQFPKDVAVTLADVADLGRLVPNDAPHQGVVIEVAPLEEIWLDELLSAAGEQLIQPNLFERRNLDYHALVRRIIGNQAAKVGDVGKRDRDVLRELHEGCGFARRPS